MNRHYRVNLSTGKSFTCERLEPAGGILWAIPLDTEGRVPFPLSRVLSIERITGPSPEREAYYNDLRYESEAG